MSVGFLKQQDILQVVLDQAGPSHERKLAIIDKNRDLYLTSTKSFGSESGMLKLGKFMIQTTLLSKWIIRSLCILVLV